jgi:molybdate transport system substrate-binding protein
VRRFLLGLLGVVAVACSTSPGAAAPSGSPKTVDLTIFGAASLSEVLAEVERTYEATVPGTTLTLSTDSSAALAAQIEQGAPADVFLAADTTNPAKLVEAGFARGEAVVFARNRLAVIVPKGNSGKIASPADLARDGVKVIAAGDEVPITTYAKQLVASLANDPAYPPYFAQRYAANVVSKEDNVKAVVAKVALGEGDAGIVYVTDARAAADEVDTLELPDEANVSASYAGVVVKASRHPDAAATFLDRLVGPAGQSILARFGFLPPA